MTFLKRRFVVEYHSRLVDLFGGSHGLRDAAGLDSALAQAQASFDGQYLHHDVFEMAAAYGYHLIKNHPFIDGNKRIAAVSMATFLDVNGVRLVVDEVELYQVVQALATGALQKAELVTWLRAAVSSGRSGS